MKRLPIVLLMGLMVSQTFLSCEDCYDDYECTCPHGGVIGGWDEPDDTTSVNQEDTTGGFEISVGQWDNPETHDIYI